ncbi:MAG: glycine--tRNA ligase subunit beta [Acidobacteria bacterium]|jgi:glycyl-tRNA synthetase beta chain|nr:MAG: glycine--tRNA ligase subunit beta [Acidobacteriota bacterium]
MRDLLIEIGTEELPAGVINLALNYLKGELSKVLKRDDIKVYGTPRRLALFVKNFENRAEEREEILVGPPVNVAYQEGKPSRALLGFLQKIGAGVEDIFELQKGEGVYVAVRRKVREDAPLERLKKSFESILLTIPFPKNMRWDSSNLRFSRPIRWILALYGDEVLPLGFGSLKAGRITYGHRIIAPKPIEIKEAGDYEGLLKDNYVVPDYRERLGMVLAFISDEACSLGGKPKYPEGLPEEVANLVEFPFALVGRFDEKYLDLPERVIVTVLAHHQRFFCVEKDGRLLPYFIAISNNFPRDGVIVKGYEKVIRARLEDALFFYKEDLKRPLEDLVSELSGILFHPKAGSMLDKVQRVMSLAERIASSLRVDEKTKEKIKRASYLCKADLLTHMVRELDELQGYMGYVYAKEQGEEDEVALALYEHYLPRNPSDPIPSSHTSAILALADKLDSLKTLMDVGEEPTGSSDPYSMKRLAYGIFSIVEAFGWNLDLKELFGELSKPFENFLRSRLEAYLEPYPYDLVRSVLEVKDVSTPYEVIDGVKSLVNMKEREEFKEMVEVYRRVVRILPADWGDTHVDEDLLVQKEERELWEAYKGLKDTLNPLNLAKLKPYVDSFFDSVLVMAPEENLRRNRLSMLLNIKRLFNRFADFSKVGGVL